ncbi:MAG TPA: uroporphyrinogen decarboxylase family protein [Armatimonadota bacterium]|nr:uroporphyrinogen decarboxylase family protein [Armatimonadota bacterium]
MTSRERILTTLQGGVPDRIGRADSPWSETIARWRREGLGENEDVGVRFGFDFGGLEWTDLSLRLPVEVIEDTDEYTIQRDANGVLRKDLKRDSGHTPQWLEHTIRTRADWERLRPRLVWSDDRINASVKETYDRNRERGLFVHFAGVEAYEATWPVWGQVGVFTQMMDDPDLIGDCFATYTDLIIASAARMLEMGIDFDGAWFYGDLGYRNSTLFSPALYDRLLFPQHKRMCDFFNARGKPVLLHSCGRIQELIPRFIEAGFAAIQPLEAKAGQDVRELKRIYGKAITFFGNIDVRKMSGTREELREELLSKLAVAAKDGGYIYHSDHSVPPTVSWDNYCYLMELLDEHGRY